MIYAGIGSRSTPDHIRILMTQWANFLARSCYTLRSGGAVGADTAFENGCSAAFGIMEIFSADDAKRRPDWREHASRYHPAWSKCSIGAQLLHARNSAIILGADLNSPVEFVLCWTKDGKTSGGTGQGIRLAEALEIPVFNLHDTTANDRLRKRLGV